MKIEANEPNEKEAYTESNDGDARAYAGARAINHENGHFSSEAYAGTGLRSGNHEGLSSRAGAAAEPSASV